MNHSAWMPYQDALDCFRGYRPTRRVLDSLGRPPVAIEVCGAHYDRLARLLFELPRDREPLPVNQWCRQYAYLG